MTKNILAIFFYILQFLVFSVILKALYFNDSNSIFINRWDFQNLCKFVYDPGTDLYPTNYLTLVSFDPSLVKVGDIVFIRDVKKYFDEIHPKIKNPYIIITHGHYKDAFKQEYTKYLEDKKIIAWFGIHTHVVHPKFYPIPIGIFQKRSLYQGKTRINNLFKQFREIKKSKLAITNFRFTVNKIIDDVYIPYLESRFKVVEKFRNNKSFTFERSDDAFVQYLEKMAMHKFTFSPSGLEIDCYRTYEALLVGSIPIVISSILDSLFKDLPVLIIKNWEEISEEFLEKKYIEITSRKYDISKLHMDYWQKKIYQVRDEYLRKYNYLK